MQKGDGTLVTYGYDASGNRISKSISGGKTSYYSRDAQGNVMGVYEQQGSTYSWVEQNLYVSSRLNMLLPGLNISGTLPTNNYDAANNEAELDGKRRYELSNRLGNVMVTVSDIKQTDLGVNLPDVVSDSYSYLFGMQMPDRRMEHLVDCLLSCLTNTLLYRQMLAVKVVK